MSPDRDRLRRYLLGVGAESESEQLERDYFAREEMLDEVTRAEEELIEDYLTWRLTSDERQRFESHYLASPGHRRRVAMTRALSARGRGPARRTAWMAPLMSLAAAMVVALLGGFLWQRGTSPGGGSSVGVTLPAVLLRDGGAIPEARLHSGVSILVVRFEAGSVPAPPPLEAAIRTVEGAEVWRGPAVPLEAQPGTTPPLLASADVPASALAGGDYIVVLETREAGGMRELQRSALRVVREE